MLERAVTERLLERHRAEVSGPGRVTFVVVIDSAGGVERAYTKTSAPEADPSSFGQHLHRIWSRHDVGSVVPVVAARRLPPHTCVSWVRLPWGPPGAWCTACGARVPGDVPPGSPGAEKEMCDSCLGTGVSRPSAMWGARP